ncbi:Cd(II)/Pb(II)-responsive transcriptional regulator [Caballeronia sp. NK8]|uniref:Cd(II)/Pb(II)-responsive transcriptional regulator n=1 Tax=Caballeronia sp. NK8 TaxID=140098 RepID=UPI001BB554FE|nr:Cd(II)/Pb(II)-responsive transcriptional regulator [Caballeronia sp. NK8]BCQ25764.1 Cd(II)/Pb(II)-responsive transcriptional regulator [Caballeronia sp. NK8]
MKIGELAKLAKCTTETIRFYEREALLPPPDRTAANYRSYNSGHVDRLRFIRNCRALDMTHDEVRALLAASDGPGGTCESVNALVDEHIAHVDARIAELTQLREQLTTLRNRCGEEAPLEQCGIVEGLTSMETVAPRARTTHLG